jgi:hypothetical protein
MTILKWIYIYIYINKIKNLASIFTVEKITQGRIDTPPSDSCYFLALFILWLWRWKRLFRTVGWLSEDYNVYPKRHFILIALQEWRSCSGIELMSSQDGSRAMTSRTTRRSKGYEIVAIFRSMAHQQTTPWSHIYKQWFGYNNNNNNNNNK